MRAASRAKINLFLHLTGQRPDGYHLVQSLLCPIGLFDAIEIRLSPLPASAPAAIHISRSGALTALAESTDLTCRAVRAF
ncbi:MAG: hypothetical protein HC848_07960 [Limnobacter sp.]|nr:hypothetical protein [Limnobacter sp.]